MDQILADAKTQRAEALAALAKLYDGTAKLPPGVDKEDIEQELLQHIARFEKAMRQLGWTDDS
jgi:hypothetical protein